MRQNQDHKGKKKKKRLQMRTFVCNLRKPWVKFDIGLYTEGTERPKTVAGRPSDW